MKTLYIYHPGTGTVISLSDEVYLVNTEWLSEDILDDMSNGLTLDESDHKGYRIDNYNMTNLFFGVEE